MEEIKLVTEEIEIVAHENIAGFDHTELCFKTVFDLFNDRGVFVKVFRGLTSFNIQDKNQIELKGLKYAYAKMGNGKIYPIVDLILCVQDLNCDFDENFCLTLTPFNASLDNEAKDAGVYGLYNKELSQLWILIMKGFFKVIYVDGFKKYCAEVRDFKEEQIAIRANSEYLKIVAEYEEDINSINREKMIYDERIVYKVIRIFGENSEVYKALINGKEISKMIRSSMSKNGARSARYREKKILLADCKKQEEEFEYELDLYFDL